MFEILILSIVQGVTEFLPISSSSHLIVFSRFLEFENQSLYLDVSLHIGSFLAIITYFNKDIYNFIENKKIFINILIASIPLILIGYFLVKTNLVNELRNIKIIGWMTIIFGILLFVSDKFKLKKSLKNDLSIKSALFIGAFQIFSLIPGVSRSGVAISAAATKSPSFSLFSSSITIIILPDLMSLIASSIVLNFMIYSLCLQK